MPQLNIIGQAYTARSGSEDFETCKNFFIEAGTEQTKYKFVLYPTPGIEEYVDIDGSQVRQLLEFDKVLYAIIDFDFYAIDADGVATQKGTLNSTEPVFVPQMASNGLQIGIVDNGYMYAYNIAADTFVEVTNVYTLAAAPNYLTFQDGYGIYNQPGTSTWWITSINDFTTTGALDFASANTTNQDITAIVSNRQQLYIFTPVGCEVWFNSGNNDFPFERKNTSYITQGTAAPASIVTIDNTIYYLTRSPQGEGFVVKIEGDSSPVVISTSAISYLINQIESINDAIAFAYQEDGHLFYVLTFPSGDKTFVYDISQGAWHERTSTIDNDPGAGTRQGRFRANCYAFFGSRHVVGDFESGVLFSMDNRVYTEDGVPIRRERTTSHLWNDLKRISLRSITLDFQVGVGNTADPDPMINLYLSKDGGYTYGNAHVASLGAEGAYTKRIKFNRLGMSRDFVGKITTTAAVEVVLLGASAEIEAGTS